MEQLIFFVVIIFFSIIDSVARSRKKRMGGQLPQQPEEWQAEQPEPPMRRERPSYDTPPSYDADPSFDAGPSREDSPSREEVAPRRAQSSESMIPADIWDEIAGLARESQPKQQAPAPPPARKPPLPPAKRAPKPVPTARSRPTPPVAPRRTTILVTPEPATEGAAAHTVHVSHADYGTDPSERARSAHDRLDPLERALSEDASAVRRQLRVQGVHALRQAVILQEVLGAPLALRPDRFTD